MRPDLFSLFGVHFYAYGTFVALAVLVSSLLIARESQRRNEGFVILPTSGVWVGAAALFGAKVFYILQFEDWRNVWRAIFVWQGGMVAYGGVGAGLVAAVVYARLHRIPLLKGLDIAAPYVALGHGIGRIGCFLNGCCWGSVCTHPWGVRFPHGSYPYMRHLKERLLTSEAAQSLPVHATQLYEAVGLFAIAAALKWYLAKKPWDGAVAFGYLLAYGVLRFLIEGVRGDSARPLAGMTVSQLASLGLAGLALATILVYRARARNTGNRLP